MPATVNYTESLLLGRAKEQTQVNRFLYLRNRVAARIVASATSRT
jgi:hypothetical protein